MRCLRFGEVSGGAVVRLKDVADVVLGAEDYDSAVRFSGEDAVFMGIWVLPNSNSLDVIRAVKDAVNVPVLAYQVSGEYAMIAHAAAAGAFDRTAAMREALLGFKRAGASAILTYAAIEIAKDLAKK